MPAGIEENNRNLLERLHRAMCGPFTASEAAGVLALSLPRARRLLAYLASRGWLSRIRRGLYTLVPLGATSPSEWRADSWIVAAKAFAPCYIGGWSACEHWGLTEQVFRGVVVVTARPIRKSQIEVQGASLRLKSIHKNGHFGLRTVWRDRVRVSVSDPSRTIIDILDEPALGGGIRHVAEVLEAYIGGEHREDSLLVEYVKRRGNRTVFKRVGFLVETLELAGDELVSACRKAMSKGLTALDPSSRSAGRIVRRWGLRVNVRVKPTEKSG